MEDKSLTESESLLLITSMINKAKNRFSENGFLYLLWGWTILFCCVFQFVAVEFFAWEHAYFVWMITWLLMIYQIFYVRRRKLKMTRTYTEEVSGYVWMAFVFAFFVSFFMCVQLDAWGMINPLILTLYGVPVFISGGILQSRPLIAGGIFCWILVIMCLFVPVNFQILLIAAAITGAWIIPGYLLRLRYKNQLN